MVFEVSKREGATELFFEGVIRPANVKVWLYDDEAEFKSGSLQRLCESPDFENEMDLAAYFMESLKAELLEISRRDATGTNPFTPK